MKVKDLIRELQKYDPETLVLVSGYEGGFQSKINVGKYDVHRCDHFYFGDYEEWDEYNKGSEPEEPYEEAICVERE